MRTSEQSLDGLRRRSRSAKDLFSPTLRLAMGALMALGVTACGTGSPDGSGANNTRTSSAVAGQPTPTGSTAGATIPPPPIVLARAQQIATDGTGHQNRVDAPVEWVRTTLGSLRRNGGFRGDGNPTQQVYVIQLHGRFCCHPGPPGHDPTATSVFDVLAVDSHPINDLGGGASTGHPLDLTRLGIVSTFTVQ